MDIMEIDRYIQPLWGVDVALGQVEDWIKDNAVNMDPAFQRGHVWTEAQRSAYIEHILRNGKTARDIYFNQSDWLYSSKDEENLGMVVVDGKQRLTTVLKFLDNQVNAFGTYFEDFTYGDNKLNTAQSIFRSMRFSLKFNVNDMPNSVRIIEWYLQMNSAGTPHSQEELDRVRKLRDDLINEGI